MTLDIMLTSIETVVTSVASLIPRFIGILVILIIGWLIAKGLEKLVVKILTLARLEIASEKSGVANFLSKGGIRHNLTELLGALIYWLVMLVIFVMIVNTMGLTVAAELLNRIVGYIPNVVAAVFILVLGVFFATLIGTIVRAAASNAGIALANGLGRLCQTVIVIFSVTIALGQLNIQTAIINHTINIIIAAVGLAFAIAFGMGSKDIAARAMADLLDKFKSKR